MLDASTEALAAAAAALTAFLGRLLFVLVRFALSPEGRVIRRVFWEAGVKSALKARAAFAAGLIRARATDSEGGADVTAHERRLLAQETARAFRDELDVLGVLSKVADAFGGVEKLEAELARRVDAELNRLAERRK